MDWSRIAPDFRPDGSLRDIYILSASLDDWAGVWEVLTATPASLAFEVDGETTIPPDTIEAIIARYDPSKNRVVWMPAEG